MLDRITPLILTRDEEVNIARTLGQLAWAREVIVVDSFSVDGTVSIARTFANVRVLQREIDTIAGQTVFGLSQVRTPWALVLDADYFVPRDLVEEMRALAPPPSVTGYRGRFLYAVGGHPLRASLYPPRLLLLAREHARVWQDGHTPRFEVDGDVRDLANPIIHDDRKNFARFLERQRKYMREEAEKLRSADAASLSLSSRVRKLVVVAPFAVLFHTLFVKGLILDGGPGLRYAWERFVAEAILSRELMGRTGRPQR